MTEEREIIDIPNDPTDASETKKSKLKKATDLLALIATLILALGVSLVCAVVIVLELKALLMLISATAAVALLSLPVLIPVFIVLVLSGGLTESMVYHEYTKKFFRHLLIKGFFEGIEQHVLKRELVRELYNGKKFSELTPEEKEQFSENLKNLREGEKKRILTNCRREIISKKIAVGGAAPIAIITAIGFAAFTFSHVINFLTFFGIASGLALSVCPWTLAIPIGIVYGIVIFSMLYRAIKNDIFAQIKDQIVNLFFKNGWKDLPRDKKIKHICTCVFTTLGVGIVIAFSIGITIVTAGAWLDGSVVFFKVAFNLISPISKAISWPIAAVMTATDAFFTTENILETVKGTVETVKGLANTSWEKVTEPFGKLKSEINEVVEQPSKLPGKLWNLAGTLLKFFINVVPFIIHVLGIGAIAVLGAPTFKHIPNMWNKISQLLIGFGTGTFPEVLVDAHAVFNVKRAHEGGHDHSHDVAGVLEEGINNTVNVLKKGINNTGSWIKQRFFSANSGFAGAGSNTFFRAAPTVSKAQDIEGQQAVAPEIASGDFQDSSVLLTQSP